MSFDFSFSSIMAGIIFSGIGLWIFREGKRKLNYTILFIGLALMIYPYFITSPIKNWGTGILLCLAAKLFWDAG